MVVDPPVDDVDLRPGIKRPAGIDKIRLGR